MACYSMGFKWSCHFDPVFFLFPHFEISSNQRGPNNARSTIVQDTINSSSTWMTHLVLAACFKTLMIVLTTRKIRCFWPQDSCTAMFLSIDGRMLAPMPRCCTVPGQTLRCGRCDATQSKAGWFHLSKCSPVPAKLPRSSSSLQIKPAMCIVHAWCSEVFVISKISIYYHACIAR